MRIFRIKRRGKLFEVNRTAPIHEIPISRKDREIVLKFERSCLVSVRGNIRLSGNQEMEGTPGDLLCLISDGTLWHETSRVVK